MARYGAEYVEALATIAAKAASTRKVASVEEAVAFANWSVREVGDASVDNEDFQAHWTAWRAYLAEADSPWEATRRCRRLQGERIWSPRPLVEHF